MDHPLGDSAEPPSPAKACLGSHAARLRDAGLRPTRQRIALAKLIFDQGDRHVSAEMIQAEAKAQGVRLALATIYNNLRQFTAARLLREVTLEGARGYFDTNPSHHHHFWLEEDGRLIDIPADDVALARLPAPPEGLTFDQIDVIIRLRKA